MRKINSTTGNDYSHDGRMTQAIERLLDKNNGKVLDWKKYKMGSNKLAESYERLFYESKAARVAQCATELNFAPTADGGKKLINGHFCYVKLCPMCAMRRTRKIFGQVSKIMNYIEQHESYRYVFLTLTVRNVSGEELSGTMDKLMKAFNKMTRRVAFMKMSLGWFRAMELTHNWKTDTYHPHFHLVIAVDEKYFNRRANFMTHKAWKEEWQKCMELDYEPYVHIQRVSKTVDEDGEIGYKKAIAEISKYTAKSNDYLIDWKNRKAFEKEIGIKLTSKQQAEEMTDRVVAVLDEALHKRRLVAFGGKMKEIHKLLNLDNPEDGDLVGTDINDDKNPVLEDVILRYRWSVGFGDYVLINPENPENLEQRIEHEILKI